MHCCVPMYIVRNMSVPGWNKCVKELKDRHAVAKDDSWLWNVYGGPNQGHLYPSMRTSRAQFKYALVVSILSELTKQRS